MIFTRLKLINLCSFADAELDLSFPRKLVNSALDGEYLYNRPKFYYKKVCIVTGANASGKTSLGRILLGIQLFLRRKVLHTPAFPAGNKKHDSSFEVDFATEDFYHHRIYVRLGTDSTDLRVVKEIKYEKVFIRNDDSCIKTTKALDNIFCADLFTGYTYLTEDEETGSIPESFNKFQFHGGWYYLLSEIKESTATISRIDKKIFELLIKVFDSSIESVSELKMVNEKENDADSKESNSNPGFYIQFKNSDGVIVTKSGDVTNPTRLSRGTYDAVILSQFISSVNEDFRKQTIADSYVSMTYFLDERMAFVHSELERTIITLIISRLKSNSQFFYTTHNTDVFKLDLPVHSYFFIKKHEDESVFIDASSYLKKNDRNLYKYVENDVFGVLPDLSSIEGLI